MDVTGEVSELTEVKEAKEVEERMKKEAGTREGDEICEGGVLGGGDLGRAGDGAAVFYV